MQLVTSGTKALFANSIQWFVKLDWSDTAFPQLRRYSSQATLSAALKIAVVAL